MCEGYTDVIGFHRAGIERAVATCGTALTEDHVRLLKRYASRVVLAFDADKAGQGAAARFYEWEEKYQVEVSVARFPEGQDPGDLASSNPDLLREAVDERVAVPRVPPAACPAEPPASNHPKQRSRLANEAMAVINEHPNIDVRKLYAGQVASHTGLPVADLVKVAADRRGYVADTPVAPRVAPSENAEFGAVALLLQRWDDIAPWLVESLFSDDVVRRAFLALAEAASDLDKALELADPEAREVLERAAVADLDLDPEIEARNLIRAAVRRELGRRTRVEDPAAIREDVEARQRVEGLDAGATRPGARGVVATVARPTERGARLTSERTFHPPFDGVDPAEWELLLTRGDAAGTLHADSIAHVVRNIELSEDVLIVIRNELTARNISIDDRVEDVAEVEEPTPAEGVPVPMEKTTEAEDTAAWAFASRRRRRALRMSEKHETTSTSDTVRMYLKEIGRVSLLSGEDERRLAKIIEDGNLAAERLDISNGSMTADETKTLMRSIQAGQRAKSDLIQANLRLVVSIAKRYAGRGHAVPRSDPGGQPRPHAGGRQVRPHEGLQVLHVRDVVDPPGDHPCDRRPGAHDPDPRPHGREHEPGAAGRNARCTRSSSASRRSTSWPSGARCRRTGCARSCGSRRIRCRSTRRWGRRTTPTSPTSSRMRPPRRPPTRRPAGCWCTPSRRRWRSCPTGSRRSSRCASA